MINEKQWVDVILMTATNPAFTSTSLGLISPSSPPPPVKPRNQSNVAAAGAHVTGSNPGYTEVP